MKINNTLILSTILAIFCFSAHSEEISTNAALMQSMDKLTGRVKKITVPVNSQINYGDFSLVLRACKKNPPEETPENFAFVDVADKSLGDKEYNIFRGWMLSSTPGMNAIEHPIYDVWLLECVDEDISNAKLLSKEELDRRDALPTKEFVVEKQSKQALENSKNDNTEAMPKKTIHIKEFISGDRDIEKNIKTPPQEITKTEVKEIQNKEEGPVNLLDFAKNLPKEEAKQEPQVEPEESIDENLMYY